MNRILNFAYGLACYAIFFLVFLYLIGFVADAGVPKSVSSGEPGAIGIALAIDLALIMLFGVQHSVMARRGFKRWLTRWLPASIERSTYVLVTSLVLILTYALWQPLPGQLWRVEDAGLVKALYALMALGWLLVLFATFLTNHFDLFGLRQVWLQFVRRSYTPVPFREWLLYRWIRHPMMLGLIVAFWATPSMSASHALFSLGMTLYIAVGVHYEEASLKEELGAPYRDYVARTGRILPFF